MATAAIVATAATVNIHRMMVASLVTMKVLLYPHMDRSDCTDVVSLSSLVRHATVTSPSQIPIEKCPVVAGVISPPE